MPYREICLDITRVYLPHFIILLDSDRDRPACAGESFNSQVLFIPLTGQLHAINRSDSAWASGFLFIPYIVGR